MNNNTNHHTLQQLVSQMTDEQLQETINQYHIICNGTYNTDDSELLNLCWLEQQQRKAYDYLTQDQTADLLGNDNAHYVWDGDDLFYLAHPDQDDSNY
jgi:hypothetical protein